MDFAALVLWITGHFALRRMTKCTGHDTEEALVVYFNVREIRTPNLMNMKQQTHYLKIKKKIIQSRSYNVGQPNQPNKEKV